MWTYKSTHFYLLPFLISRNICFFRQLFLSREFIKFSWNYFCINFIALKIKKNYLKKSNEDFVSLNKKQALENNRNKSEKEKKWKSIDLIVSSCHALIQEWITHFYQVSLLKGLKYKKANVFHKKIKYKSIRYKIKSPMWTFNSQKYGQLRRRIITCFMAESSMCFMALNINWRGWRGFCRA